MILTAPAKTAARAALSALAALLSLAACDDTFRFDEPAADASTDAAGDAAVGEIDAGRAPCSSDTSCGGMRCDTARGACVACLGDSDCSGSRAHCDVASNLCVECTRTDDCKTRQRCDATTHRCLDTCFDEDDPCPGDGFVCDRTLRTCIECRSSANCSGSASGAICDVPIGRCVACTSNAQCAAPTPACDRRSGRCVGCLTSSACSGGICDKVTSTCR